MQGKASATIFMREDEPRSSGRNPEADFHGETRTNATHASTTDPETRLYRKSAGTEATSATP